MTQDRLPIASPIESRTASLTKDSYSKNCYFETRDGKKEIIKRPGLEVMTITPALSQQEVEGMYEFSGDLYVASNNSITKITTSHTSSSAGTMTGTPTALVFFNQVANGQYMTLQNGSHLYTLKSDGTFAVASQLDTILSSLSLGNDCMATGIVYLDGFTFIMLKNGRIYNSGIEAPLTWDALNYITAEAEPDGGVGIVKHFNYLVAFGTWSTEFFYDGAGSAGYVSGTSPLFRNDSARLEIGCANGGSIVQIEQSVIWVGKSRKHGKSVFVLDGLSPAKISTPYIEKYLNNDQTDTIRAYALKIAGHTFYIMTMRASDLTFVYDMDEKVWYNWSSVVSTGPTGSAVVGIAIAGLAAVGTNSSHAGAIAEHYFKPTFYAEWDSDWHCIDESNATLYMLSSNIYTDGTAPIYFKAVTDTVDSGTTKRKFYRSLEIIGDKVSGTLQVRHSDDDYNNWSNYRNIVLNKSRAQLFNLGSARRRAWDFLCTESIPIRLDAAEINFDIGDMEGASN